MIALADSYLFTLNNPSFAGLKPPVKPSGDPLIIMQDGRYLLLREPRSVRAWRRRHKGLFNVAFCDAHVESLKPEVLFGKTDPMLRRWNNDHQPHREKLVE